MKTVDDLNMVKALIIYMHQNELRCPILTYHSQFFECHDSRLRQQLSLARYWRIERAQESCWPTYTILLAGKLLILDQACWYLNESFIRDEPGYVIIILVEGSTDISVVGFPFEDNIAYQYQYNHEQTYHAIVLLTPISSGCHFNNDHRNQKELQKLLSG